MAVVQSKFGLLFIFTCALIVDFNQSEPISVSKDLYESSDFKKEIESGPKNTQSKNNNKLNVIFLTPWTESKKLVLDYIKKIDILIPCWFDLKPEKFNDKYHTQVNKFINI